MPEEERMSETKMVEPAKWDEFLNGFSERNRGRRARFELFRRDGEVAEEGQEGYFESASIDDEAITITRIDKSKREEYEMKDRIPNIHGIAVQLDSDGSDNTLELTNARGDMTVLHFESTIDGDS